MPFPISHMAIAKGMIKLCPAIAQNLPQFYMGSLAPDAVHFRPNMVPDDKKASHLCRDALPWGQVIDNTAWLDQVMGWYFAHEQDEQGDFIRGYCAHILSDIYHNIHYYGPYCQSHPEALRQSAAGTYHEKSKAVDFALAQQFEDREAVWAHLQGAHGITLSGMVDAGEIERMKATILYTQYSHSPGIAPQAYDEVTYRNTLQLIQGAAGFALERLGFI